MSLAALNRWDEELGPRQRLVSAVLALPADFPNGRPLLALPGVSARPPLLLSEFPQVDSGAHPDSESEPEPAEWTIAEVHFLKHILSELHLTDAQVQNFTEYFISNYCSRLRRLRRTQYGPRVLAVLEAPDDRELVFGDLKEVLNIDLKLNHWKAGVFH